MNPAGLQAPAGLSRPDLPRAFTPKEFAAALELYGVTRSVKWVRAQCARRRIHCLPAFTGYFIPACELERVLTDVRRRRCK